MCERLTERGGVFTVICMRLVGSAQPFSSRVFGEQVISDMCSLYDCNFFYVAADCYGDEELHFDSCDGGVHASLSPSRDRHDPDILIVNIPSLQRRVNRARWLALQVYRIWAGIEFAFITAEVPGRVAHTEWQGRAAQARKKAGSTGAIETVIPPFSASLFDPQLTDRAAATRFHAQGRDLPAAARTLANGYGELVYHCDDDPENTVAGALGVGTLAELDTLWGGAMQQETPLDAARYILKNY